MIMMNTGKKHISTDSRLSALCEMLGHCPVYADIGCDHGRMGAYLIQNKAVEKAYLTDISAESLQKARKLIRLLGYEARVHFCVCNGIPAEAEDARAFVIAGMGGKLIADILREGRERLHDARLILQANVAQTHLRQTLVEMHYRITRETLVRDGRRFYVIIEAMPGEAQYSPRELMVGPVLLAEKPALLREYARFRADVARKALAGAQKGGRLEEERLLEEETAVWEALL